jgi:hypothetical protein
VKRPAAALIAIASALLVAGPVSQAGAGGEGAATQLATAAPPATLEALWRRPGEAVAVVPGTSDYGPGLNRISFLVVDGRSELVERPVADLWVATELKGKPYLKTVARLEEIGVPGGERADAQRLYVAYVRLPKAGKYWFAAVPRGAKIGALGNLVLGERPQAPAVGERAIPSRTPTLRSTGGDLEQLTTSRRPDRQLYTSSVRDALAAKTPFVVTFATPLFCQTRTCGPVVDVVSGVRKQLAGSGVRFIHAEVYEDNDPANPVNPWMKEWRLPTEPWTFVVGRDGRIAARFEGAFSTRELVQAVKKVSAGR